MAVLGIATACGDPAETDVADDAADDADATVVMDGTTFSPETVEIDPGDTVVFVNEEATVHDVAFEDGEASEDLDEGEAYSRTFDEEGEYAFECTFHPGAMQGTVVVGDTDDGDGAADDEVDDAAGNDTADEDDDAGEDDDVYDSGY